MTRRELIKLLGQGLCATAPAAALPTDRAATWRIIHPPSPILDEAPAPAAARVTDQDSAVSSARSVLDRLLGKRANEFILSSIPPAGDRMVYEVSASSGRVAVKGSSGVAICRGTYIYLRNACNAMVTWSGRHLNLPEKFPDCPEQRVICPNRFTQYFNICTFGYSTAFWDWERWQRELDWMAFHGINMPLALVGQEAIWRSVWNSVGLTPAEIDEFAVGPAYQPWHWMGNINRFDGPLPSEWITQRQDLQKRLLSQMRSLGMTPIVPGFSGFVPKGLKRVCSEAKILTLLWSDQGGIPMLTKTFMLHPDEADLYKEVGRRFITEYHREFGPVEYYLADLFNEMEPPVSAGSRYEDLTRFARNVYNGILAGDPNGKWVMQGWLFFNERKFWDNKSIQAFLSGIPNDRMLILDYVGDLDEQASHPLWKQCDAYFGKQWMNGMIQNFGGNNNITANLPLIASQPATVLASPDKGRLAGWAICPEGIETNEAAFELLADAGWSNTQINLQEWIPAYCRARYGGYPQAMRTAWSLLLQSAYGPDSSDWGKHFSWQRRPRLNPSTVNPRSAGEFQQAVEQFLSCSGEFGSGELYGHDLIELAAQYVGYRVDRRLASACQAQRSGQSAVSAEMAKDSLDMLVRIDAILALRPERRLTTWVKSARRFAASSDQLAYYDSDARRLLTFWGWIGLNDYAARVWAGLIRDYYAGRWRVFFERFQTRQPISLAIWEQNWLAWPYAPSHPRPVPDLAAEVRRMLDTCKDW